MSTGKGFLRLKAIQQLFTIALIFSAILAVMPASAATKAVVKGRSPAPLPPTVKPQNNATSIALQRAGRFEILWLESNIILHDRAIKMAKAEEAQTTSTELKTFSQDLQTSLSQEQTQLQGWLTTWYKVNFTPKQPTAAAMMNPRLDDSEDYDLAFVDWMIGYEHSEIGLDRMIGRTALHPELKAFAQQNAAEAQDILGLLRAWQVTLEELEWKEAGVGVGPNPFPIMGRW